MALKKTQASLRKWGEQEWTTKSGKPSIQGKNATGEKYLPKATIKSMSKKEYDRLTAKKRRDTKKGIQHSRSKKRGK